MLRVTTEIYDGHGLDVISRITIRNTGSKHGSVYADYDFTVDVPETQTIITGEIIDYPRARGHLELLRRVLDKVKHERGLTRGGEGEITEYASKVWLARAVAFLGGEEEERPRSRKRGSAPTTA